MGARFLLTGLGSMWRTPPRLPPIRRFAREFVRVCRLHMRARLTADFMDLRRFPFDAQILNISFESGLHDATELELRLRRRVGHVVQHSHVIRKQLAHRGVTSRVAVQPRRAIRGRLHAHLVRGRRCLGSSRGLPRLCAAYETTRVSYHHRKGES